MGLFLSGVVLAICIVGFAVAAYAAWTMFFAALWLRDFNRAVTKAEKAITLTELERRILTHIGRGENYLLHVSHPDNWCRAVDRLTRLGLIDRGDRYGDQRAITDAGRAALGQP